jgi:hypothetical protein
LQPSIEDTRVIELYVDTYKLEGKHGFLTPTISRGYDAYMGSSFSLLVYKCFTTKDLETKGRYI